MITRGPRRLAPARRFRRRARALRTRARVADPLEREILAALPSWPHPHVRDLQSAPELAVLAVLHAALRNALVALIAEHPTLVDLGPPSEPPTLRYARGLLDAGQALSHALGAYRGAVRAALCITPLCDDDAMF